MLMETALNPANGIEMDKGRFMRSLRCGRTGCAQGMMFEGHFAGPSLLVAGDAASVSDLASRMQRLPSLPWMHGRIILMRAPGSVDLPDGLGPIDAVMDLRGSVEPDRTEGIGAEQGRETLHLVLRWAAGLGMISGRGVRQAGPISPRLSRGDPDFLVCGA